MRSIFCYKRFDSIEILRYCSLHIFFSKESLLHEERIFDQSQDLAFALIFKETHQRSDILPSKEIEYRDRETGFSSSINKNTPNSRENKKESLHLQETD